MTDPEGYGDVAVSRPPAVPAVPVVVKPSVAQVLVVRGARVLGVVALIVLVVAGGYDLRLWHADNVRSRADAAADIRKELSGVVARADGHTVFAPAGWGAGQYPLPSRHSGIYSSGTFEGVHVDVWQVPARAVNGPGNPRRVLSLTTPASLCGFTARDVRAKRLTAGQVRRMRCHRVPGRQAARVRIIPRTPSPGVTDVRLAVALREKGRYLNVWVVDETGSVRRDPIAWSTRFLKSLKPYDVTAYSVDDIYEGRKAAGWYK